MSKRSIAVILASFYTVFTAFAIRLSYGLLLPEMLPSLEISKTEAGLIYSSFFISYTIFSPLLGLLADRFNLRVLLTLFLSILGIGTFLMGYSSSLIEACFFFALAGVGASACWSPVVTLVQRWISDRRKGFTIAFVDTGGASGIAISSAIIPLIVAAYDWRMGWKTLGMLAFSVAIINFFVARDNPLEKSNPRPSMIKVESNKEPSVMSSVVFGDAKFWLIGLSYLFIGFSTLIPYTFMSTYAVQELKLTYHVAARLITTIAVTSIVSKLALGSLSDVLGRIRAIIICEILVAISSLGIAYLQGIVAIHLFTAIFGLGHGAIWPLYAACASDYFPQKYSGSVVGLWTFFLGIGLIFSPLIAGWIADITGKFAWSFILALATSIISILLLLPYRKRISSQ